MRRLLLATSVLCAFATSAFAKEYQLPTANPAISVNLPDKWKPTDTDAGVEMTSPDGESYLAVETAPAKSVDALISDNVDFLTKNGVTFDKASQKTQDTTINGIPVSFLHWDGKDKDGPTSVTLVIVGVSDKLLMLMTSWASPAGDKANAPVMNDILGSLKRM